MKLGAFSISLNVKDINASKSFYENLGFTVFGGDLKMNYLIMKNDSSVIGLFQGMFENNIMTFNPGWDQNAKAIEDFDESHSNYEDRYTLLGVDKKGRLLLVIFCERGEKIRIISAWKAEEKEDIEDYFQQF